MKVAGLFARRINDDTVLGLMVIQPAFGRMVNRAMDNKWLHSGLFRVGFVMAIILVLAGILFPIQILAAC